MRIQMALGAGHRRRYPVRFNGPEIHYDLAQPREAPDPMGRLKGLTVVEDFLRIRWPASPDEESQSLRRFLDSWGPVWQDLATQRTSWERPVWREDRPEPTWVDLNPGVFTDAVYALRSLQDDLREWESQIMGLGELKYTGRHLPPLREMPTKSRKRHLGRFLESVNGHLDHLSLFARVTDAGELQMGIRSLSLEPYLYLSLLQRAPFDGVPGARSRGDCPRCGRPVIAPQRKFCSRHCADAFRKRLDYWGGAKVVPTPRKAGVKSGP